MSYSRTTYTSLSFRGGLELCRKSEGLAYENAENRYTPQNRPPGVRTPNSETLTEALIRQLVYC